MIRNSFLLSALLLVCATVATAQEKPVITIDTYRAFGSEHVGIYKHPTCIEELANGTLYISYYGGAGEYDSNTAVYGSYLLEEPNTWSKPEIIADTPFRGDGNPVIFQAPDGVVWLFYNTQYGPTWSESRVKGKVSYDGAKTWSDSFMVAFEQGSMVRGKVLVLNNGDYLLPMYDEKGSDREEMTKDTASYFLRYSQKTKTWEPTNKIYSKIGNLQPQVIQLTDDHLIAYMRRAGGYGPASSGFMVKSESHDGGYTWGKGVDTDIPNPNSAVDVVRTEEGHIVLVYNDSGYDRTPLTVAISKDDGKTFSIKRDIGGGDNTFAYPYMIQTKDKKLHVLYTTNLRTTIMHAVFDESAILEWPQGDE
jgi:predicted neuraminidase